MVLPVEVMVINALSKPLRSGKKVMKLFDMDELSLQLKGRAAVDQVHGLGTLLRHGYLSLACAAQGARSVHPKLAALVTVVVQKHTPSAIDWKRTKDLWGGFEGSFE